MAALSHHGPACPIDPCNPLCGSAWTNFCGRKWLLLSVWVIVAAGERGPVPGRQPKMMYPLVLDLADEGVPVTVTRRVLQFSF